MTTEMIQVSLDMTSDGIVTGGLSTPRPDNQIFKINSIQYDIGWVSGSDMITTGYIGVSPRTIDTTLITGVNQGTILNNLPKVTVVDNLVKVSTENDGGTAIRHSLSRQGLVIAPDDMYALEPTVFIGIPPAEVAANRPSINGLIVVEFEFVPLTNKVATLVATRCA